MYVPIEGTERDRMVYTNDPRIHSHFKKFDLLKVESETTYLHL